MLLVPLVVGGLAAGSLSYTVLLTLLAAFFAYLTRQPLTLIARALSRRDAIPSYALFWLTAYASFGAGIGALLIAVYDYWLLVPLVALAGLLLGVHLFLSTRRADMTVGGELIGIAGLTLGAPATYYVGAGSPGIQMLGLWLLSFLYFGGSVFYVKLKVRVHSRQQPPTSSLQRMLVGKTTVIYHVGAIALAGVLVATGLVPLLAPLAYIPVSCKAVRGTLDWRRPVNIKRLGVMEIVHSLVFAVLLVIAYS